MTMWIRAPIHTLGRVGLVLAVLLGVSVSCGEAPTLVPEPEIASITPVTPPPTIVRSATPTPGATTIPSVIPTQPPIPSPTLIPTAMPSETPLASTSPTDDLLAEGQLIFEVRAGGVGCATCHGQDGTGNTTIGGPDIQGKTEDDIRTALATVPRMRIVRLTDAEITAVAAYLKFLSEQP